MNLLTLNMLTAQNASGSAQDFLWLAITIIALIALIISVMNAFRISQVKRMLEVTMQNQKDDMELSFKKMKSSLGRDIGNMRREINKKNVQKKPINKQQPAKTKEVVKTTVEDKGENQSKKPARKPQRRKYNPHKKKTTDAKVTETASNVKANNNDQ